LASTSEDSEPEKRPRERTPVFDEQFEEDLAFWKAADPGVAARLARLVEETLRWPFEEIGRPERLRHNRRGYWSRRLTKEHRIVYRVTDEAIQFVSARFHY
jgi:toxin YoeB